MTLGCFRGEKSGNGVVKITFPNSIVGLIQQIGDLVGTIDQSIDTSKIEGIANLLKKGIQFTSPGGYCLTATIDIDGTMDTYVNIPDVTKSLGLLQIPVVNGMEGNPLTANPLDKNNGLVKKINTGDHATVKSGSEAAAVAGTNYCPDGSTLFSYELNKQLAKNIEKDAMGANIKANIGLDVNIGFDMCLKSCETSDDCRKDEGYSCVEIPNGVPAENQTVDDVPKKKACFDAANIEYFTQMTEDFKPAAN